MATRLFFSSLIVILVAYTDPAVAQEIIDNAKFLGDYKKALESLKRMNQRLEVEGELIDSGDRKTPSGEKYTKVDSTEFVCIMDKGAEKIHISKDTKGHFERVFIVTDAEQFVLRKDDKKNDLFLEHKNMPDPFREWMLLIRRNTADAPFFVAGEDVSELLELPTFTPAITRVIGVEGLYKIAFTVNPKDIKSPKFEGWFTVNTARLWTVRDFEIIEDTRIDPIRSVRHVGHLTYDEQQKIPRPMSIEIGTTENGFNQKSRLNVTKWNYDLDGKRGFDLAAYGLASEAQTPVESANVPWTYWVVMLGLAAATLSLLTRWIARKLQSRKPLAG